MSEESTSPNPERSGEGQRRSRRRRRGRGRGPRPEAQPQSQPAAQPRPQSQSGPQRRPPRGERRGDRGRRPERSPAPQPREIEITDETIFQRLTEAGFDLAQEAILEAFLYFNAEPPARRVAAQLEPEGFETYVDPSPPGRWLLEVVSRAVPTPEHISAMGAKLRSAARSGNGIYDGWWASEVPEDEEEAKEMAEAEVEAEA